MKRKIFSILFALVLVLSFSLVTAVPVAAADLNVPSPEYPTIQSAVDAANPAGGDTIIVAAGIYDEQVVINKSLTLQGAGDTTIIQPSSAGRLTAHHTIYWYDGSPTEIAGIIIANEVVGSVMVKNLKVDGGNVIACPAGANWVAGIFYRETGGVIDSVDVTNMTIGNTGTAVRGQGIYLYAMSTTVSVEVKDCRISDYDKNGINADGSELTADIHHNTVTGRGPLPEGDEVQNGILIIDHAQGMVRDNVVSGNYYLEVTVPGKGKATGKQRWTASGILLFYVKVGNGGVFISNNKVNDNQGPIGVVPEGAQGPP